MLHEQGFPLSVSTFHTIFDGLSNVWILDSRLGLLKEFVEKHFVKNNFSYTILIIVLCKEVDMDVICNLFNNMSKKGYVQNMLIYDNPCAWFR